MVVKSQQVPEANGSKAADSIMYPADAPKTLHTMEKVTTSLGKIPSGA